MIAVGFFVAWLLTLWAYLREHRTANRALELLEKDAEAREAAFDEIARSRFLLDVLPAAEGEQYALGYAAGLAATPPSSDARTTFVGPECPICGLVGPEHHAVPLPPSSDAGLDRLRRLLDNGHGVDEALRRVGITHKSPVTGSDD
jgi:hypothetical protein